MQQLHRDGSIESHSDFSFYGWTLTQPPPPITGVNQFGASPSPLIQLHANQFQPCPPQTITPIQPSSDNFSLSGPASVAGDNWTVIGNSALATILETPYCCDLTLALNMAGVGNLVITVNGHVLPPIAFNSNTLTVQTVHIDARDILAFSGTSPYNLNANSNTLTISAGSPGDAFVVASISVEASNVNVTAYAQWYQCYATTIPAGTQFSYGVQVSNGVTTTKSESETFTNSLQVSCNPTVGADILKPIGLGLSITLDVSRSVTQDNGITLDSSSVQTINYQLPIPSQQSSLQIWQLAIVYQVGTHYLTQYLGIDDGVLIINLYPEPTPAPAVPSKS